MEMKPGRELDALVAEKVMGWNFDETLGWSSADGSLTGQPNPPHYSTDIAAAWAVIEHLQRRGITAHLTLCVDPSLWRVDLRFNLEANTVGCVTSDISAPHAICLAALKAAGTL